MNLIIYISIYLFIIKFHSVKNGEDICLRCDLGINMIAIF